MQSELPRALDLVADSEQGYSDHKDDPGGPTNMGITLKTLSAWRSRSCTAADVRALTRAEATQILDQQYAQPIRFNDLPPGIDYALLDTAINSGPARATKLLQGLLGTEQDGILGRITLDALQHAWDADATELVRRYGAVRLAFMRRLKTWTTFGAGWTSRVARVEHDALAMVQRVQGAVLVVDAVPATPRPELVEGASAKATGAVKLLATPSGKSAIATLGAVVVASGAAATQAMGVLAPYAAVTAVHWAMVGLAVVSAAGTAWVAFERAENGATA